MSYSPRSRSRREFEFPERNKRGSSSTHRRLDDCASRARVTSSPRTGDFRRGSPSLSLMEGLRRDTGKRNWQPITASLLPRKAFSWWSQGSDKRSPYFRRQRRLPQSKKILSDRYGNPFLVGYAYKRKINVWPTIPTNDGTGLPKFLYFLVHRQISVKEVLYLKALNDPEENQKMVRKLPRDICNRWTVR